MAFVLFKGAKTRDTNNANDARYKLRKDGSGVLCFSNSGILKIKELGLSYKIGDKVELYPDKEASAIAFKKSNTEFALNLSRYGRTGSTRFQIYSKSLATGGLVIPGEYMIEEPRKSEAEYDFILSLIKDKEAKGEQKEIAL